MSYKYTKGQQLGVGFGVQSNRPLDEKEIVLTKEDLRSIPNTYAGIEVKVEDEGFAKYRWNGIDQNTLTNWVNVDQFGGGGTGDGDMLKAQYDTNNNGVVDNSEGLGGQPPSYYLNISDPVGDMSKSTYDTNNNSKVDDSDKLGGQNPSYYDQNAHVANTQVHLSTDERNALDNSPTPPTGANPLATQADIAASGGGDMLSSEYATNGQTGRVDNAQNLDGQPASTYNQSAHVADVTTNPHQVDANDVNLGNVDNTTDADKPISTATQTALDGKVEEAPEDGTPYARQDAGWVAAGSGGQTLYDGVDTKANILALNPSLYLGQKWFASDEKVTFKAFTSGTLLTDVWQQEGTLYNELTDTFEEAPTQDGQVQNIGQEIFFPAFNTGTVVGTALSPKIYKAIGAYNGAGNFKEVVEAGSGDISSNSVFGFNTTESNLDSYTKILTWGNLNGVDTSAWPINTVLYLSPTAGEVTEVKPTVNAFPVALVTKQDALIGQLFVNTAAVAREDIAGIPVELTRINFTADESTTSGGTFYQALRESEGVATEAIQTKTVNDDEKLPLDQDWLAAPVTIPTTINIASYTGQIEFSINDTGSQEKLYLEVYLADANGLPLDPGNGKPNGSLGQPPIFTLESSLLNTNANVTNYAPMTGFVDTTVDLAVGQRTRSRILVEKVGTQGASKVFSVFSGSDHQTFFNVPKRIQAKDVLYNNVDSSLTTNDVKSALDEVTGRVDTAVQSITATEPPGADQVINTVSLTQAQYDAGPISLTTIYYITDAL